MVLNLESGLRNFRIEYVEETTTGAPPTDPAWKLFSDTVELFGSADLTSASITPGRGLGDADVLTFFLGAETASFPIRYWQHVRDLTGDVLNDFIVRDADNNLSTSHTVVAREERTLSVGVDGGGSRNYTVGLGGFGTSFTLSGQLEPPTPLLSEPTYTFEKVRVYRVDQPSSATLIGINSTDTGDTTQDVTVEDEGASTSQTASLAGTTEVSMGVSTYADIDAIRLSAETVGDVEVWINTGTDTAPVKGAVLATIRGSGYYGSEGDLGIPLLGSGAHASAIGDPFATLSGSTIEWGGAALADVVVSTAELRTDNMQGGEVLPTAGTRRQKILIGGTEHIVAAQLVGEFGSHEGLDQHLGGTEQTFTWAIGSGANQTIQITGALKLASGGRTYDQSAALVLDAQLQGKALSIV